VGVERLGEHNLGLARAFCAGADLPAPAAPIVKAELAKPQEVARQLRERGINCAAHSDGVRLAFHLYNDEADVHAALDALAPFAERRR
jgi:selenocysteine lyase/cysteine desulfurase